MDQLEEIKSKIDIVSFISEYLPLKKTGRNFKALCPFHSEKTPSFIVSLERQIWHCFGCNLGGDIFGFLMRMENLEFPEALEILAKRAGVKLIRSYQASEQSRLKEKIYQINHLASEFYHYLLLNHQSGKSALDYVLGRGVNKKSMETFKLGWAPNQWDALLKFLIKKGFTFNELELAGLIIKSANPPAGGQVPSSKYYDRFRGRLMFTLKDHRGNVIGFAGRTLDPKATEAKYINTPETSVYIKGNVLYGLDVTKEVIKKEDRVIIVEGEFDLISSFQAGVANVVAIKGSALSENQVNLLKRFSQNLSLALDMDLAGDAAARRGIEIAEAAGLNIKVVKLPTGKDPDECARANPHLWQKAVQEAVPVFDYSIDSALARFGNQTAEGKKKIGDEVLPIIAKISNPIVQSHYLKKLATVLAVAESTLAAASQKILKQKEIGLKTSAAVPAVTGPSRSRQELLEEELLAMILQSEEPAKPTAEIGSQLAGGDFLTPPSDKILKILAGYLQKTPKFQIKDFIKTLPKELVSLVDRAYLLDLGQMLGDRPLFERNLGKTIKEIKKLFLRRKLLALASQDKPTASLAEDYRQISAELKQYQ